MTIITKLINTLSSLKGFTTIVAIVVGLIRNMLWTFVFFKQSAAWCSKLKQIMHGYFNGTLVGLTCCAIISTIGLTTLVGTTSTTSYYPFLLW